MTVESWELAEVPEFWATEINNMNREINRLRAKLAEIEGQEPVAWEQYPRGSREPISDALKKAFPGGGNFEFYQEHYTAPLYAAPVPAITRHSIGEAASHWLHENAEGLDWCDARNVDALLDAILPVGTVPTIPALASDDRNLSDIGNEIHNLSCRFQNDEDVSNQLSMLACELWRWEKSVPAIPEGWQLVPVEATDDMISTACDATNAYRVDAMNMYDAMLAAAPKPEDKGEQ